MVHMIEHKEAGTWVAVTASSLVEEAYTFEEAASSWVGEPFPGSTWERTMAGIVALVAREVAMVEEAEDYNISACTLDNKQKGIQEDTEVVAELEGEQVLQRGLEGT